MDEGGFKYLLMPVNATIIPKARTLMLMARERGLVTPPSRPVISEMA